MFFKIKFIGFESGDRFVILYGIKGLSVLVVNGGYRSIIGIVFVIGLLNNC